jgi:hypothetical protein
MHSPKSNRLIRALKLTPFLGEANISGVSRLYFIIVIYQIKRTCAFQK